MGVLDVDQDPSSTFLTQPGGDDTNDDVGDFLGDGTVKPATTAQLGSVPGDHELWRVGAMDFLVWTAPGSNPPIYMAWRVTADQFGAIFGAGKSPFPDKKYTWDQANSLGFITHGSVTNINNTSDHPFETFIRDFERESTIRPWLLDPEMLAITTAALVEGRSVTDAELKTTNWWQTHTSAERQWLSLNASDPAEALSRVDTQRRNIRDALISLGSDDPDSSLVSYIADRVTTGQWNEAYGADQVRKLSDPYAPGVLDSGLEAAAAGVGVDTTRAEEGTVRDLLSMWLGPRFGTKSDTWIGRWAGEIRNNPDAQGELTRALQGERMALFPAYGNENLTYEDIASPVRSQYQRIWGQEADEDTDLFSTIMGDSDIAGRESRLRLEGLNRGISRVTDDFQSDVLRSLGGQVRRAV